MSELTRETDSEMLCLGVVAFLLAAAASVAGSYGLA